MLSKLICSGLSVLAFGYTALGADNSLASATDPVTFNDTNAAMSDIQGTWLLGCQSFDPSTSWPPDDSQSARYTYTFTGNDFTWLEENFSDKGCKKPLMSRAFKGTFKVGEPVQGLDNVYALDLLTIRETYKLLDPSARVYDYCRGGDNVLTDVSECDFKDLYQIIRVDSKSLRFGRYVNETDGDSPDSRPKFLNNIIYTRP